MGVSCSDALPIVRDREGALLRAAGSICSRPLALIVAAATLAMPLAARAADDSSSASDSEDIVVTARRFEEARDAIFQAKGADHYRLDRAQLDRQPGGGNASLEDVLTLTPGVTRDGYGSLHIRNDCTNLQYRIDGVALPDAVGGFGQAIDPRIAGSIDVLTGALPAQYGFRTAGVVDLVTRPGALRNGGDIGFEGGDRGVLQPNGAVWGSSGSLTYFVSGSYLQSDLGVENPTSSPDAIHDRTTQYRAFGYLAKTISDTSRISLMGGTAIGNFQIPDNPGQTPQFTLNGRSDFDSALLDQNEREVTDYLIVPFVYAGDAFSLQVAPFLRYSRTRFLPDPQGGDLIFTGVADQSRISSFTAGAQADGKYTISPVHTLRFGLLFQNERTRSRTVSRVFPADAAGNQTSDVPLTIAVNGGRDGQSFGSYVQDEWAVTPRLTLNLGLRFDAVRSYTREQQLSPRASVVWKPAAGTVLHLGYARNFTPPEQKLVPASTLALFVDTTKATEITAADTVRAEREHYLDAGIKQTVLPGLDLDLRAYYKAKRNEIDEGQFGAALVLTPFNYERGYAWGVEMAATYRHGPFEAYLNVARGEEKARHIVSSQYFFSQEELDYIARHYIFTDHSQRWTGAAGGSATVRNHFGALTPSFSLTYGDGMRTEDTVNHVPNGAKLPSYVNVNLGIAQAFSAHGVLGGVSVRIDVVNLFDHAYLLRDGDGVGVGAPQYGARRGVLFGIRKAF